MFSPSRSLGPARGLLLGARPVLRTALPRLRNCFPGRLEPGHPPAQATEHDAEVAATTAHIQQAARGALRKRAKGLACERSPVAPLEQFRCKPAKHRIRR